VSHFITKYTKSKICSCSTTYCYSRGFWNSATCLETMPNYQGEITVRVHWHEVDKV